MKSDMFICAICFHAETCTRIFDIAKTGMVHARQHVCKHKQEEHFTLVRSTRIVGLFGVDNE